MKMGTELNVLIEQPIENLLAYDTKIGRAIANIRKNQNKIEEGGGGKYGKLLLG